MKPQTQRTPEEIEPGTPVIIKMGGNGPVYIESSQMPFKELVPGPTWVVSQSTLKKRIEKLTISGEQDQEQRNPELLASIRIEYGEATQLLVMESGNPDNNDIFLVIASVGVPFEMTKPEEWETARSTATFPPLTRIVFMEGTNIIFNRQYTDDPQVTLEIP